MIKCEWKPIKCAHFQMFGHEELNCRKKENVRKVWRVKVPTNQKNEQQTTVEQQDITQ